MTGRMSSPLVIVAFLLVSSHVVSGIKISSDGGYTNLVIKITDQVPEDSCPKILTNIKKLLTEGSHVLHEAFDNRVYLKSATIVIPKSWRDSMCQTVIHGPQGDTPYRQPDIFIQDKHPIYGQRPFTQQSRGCGQPGDFTAYPYDFLTAWNNTWETWGDPAKLFVSEWAKLRYGVFDEHGYAGDPLYPHFYKSNGGILPTGTSDQPINGEWKDLEGRRHCDPATEEDCYFVPVGTNDQVTCSLGYMHYLPSVRRFCSGQTMAMAPTKHNVVCGGHSSGEIIMSHEDFLHRSIPSKRQSTTEEDSKRVEPELTIVREPETQYVMVIETSSSMDNHNQWKWINKAAQKFIRYDLPLHANLAIVTFSNTSKVEHSMAAVHSDDVRARLADTVPDKYHLSHSDVKCLLCGVQKAIHEVLRINMAGAHLVLVTRGSADTLSISDEQTIEEYVKYYHIKVSSILVPEDEKLPLAFYDSIAQSSGGSSHVVPRASKKSIEVYVGLMHAFSGLLVDEQPKLPVVVHEELIEMTGYSSSTGRFTIDTTLGRDTKFGIYVDDEEDHLIKSVTFTDSKGFLFGPYTSMSSLYDIINLKTVNFPIGEAPPFDDPERLGTEWQYYVEWYPGGSSHQRSAVRLTSQPRYGEDDISVDIWTNSDSSSDLVTSQHPLAVYAKVIKGSSPVLNADVLLTIDVAMPNGTAGTMTLSLLDNGNGDSDLVAGDGIYSRYLTQYRSAGRYSFSVRVTSNYGRASTIRSTRRNRSLPQPINSAPLSYGGGRVSPLLLAPCCGSRVSVDKDDLVPTGAFERKGKGPVIHLLSVPTNQIDLMPPARIGDLKIEVLPDSGQLMATWTAPGDDYDVGTVTGYRFIVADNISSLLDPMAELQTLVGFRQPDKAGSQTSYQFGIARIDEHYDKDIFVGIVAFDEKDNEGKLSNIVTLHLTSDGVYDSKYPEIPRNHPVSAKPDDDDSQAIMIGVLCGTIAVMALLLWAGIWYFRNQKISTKKSGVTANLVLENEAQSTPQTNIRRESQSEAKAVHRHLMKPQLSDDNNKTDNNTTPIYWSASQLLGGDQERNQSNNNVGAATQQLDPIREEYTDDILETEDAEVYAQGLANYGYQTQKQMLHMVQQTSTPLRTGQRGEILTESLIANSSRLQQSVHEPVYVGYSPDTSQTIYATTSRSQQQHQGKKVPPKVPPKPSINALLGIGMVMGQTVTSSPIQRQATDIYATTTKRHISHV